MKRGTLPDPQPGLVIRYAYLWRSEADGGRQEGVKDRPCVVVLAVRRDAGETRVVVAPVTHSPPSRPDSAIELPVGTKSRLGLDDERSWVVTDEVNVFVWPGPDIRIVDGADPTRRYAYGFLPRALARAIIDGVRAHLRHGRSRPVGRD